MEGQGSFTKARYLKMCLQQNIEPDLSELPIDIEDFPQVVRDAIEIFNRLPDRFVSTELGPLYTGKDIAAIQVLYDVLNVTDRVLALEIVQHLDAKAVNQAVRKHKQAQDKIRAKSRNR